MTRAASKAQARRRKKERQAIAASMELAQTPRRDRSGCYIERTRQQAKDPHPQEVAFKARMRQTGMTAEQAREEMAGCAVGRKLLLDHISDRADLWKCVKHIRKTVLAYDRAIGAPIRHAKCASIMANLEKLEATSSSPPTDTRSEEERFTQDIAAWMRLKGWMSGADYSAREACMKFVVDEPDEPIGDWTGIVLALRCVNDGLKGGKVTDRSRSTIR